MAYKSGKEKFLHLRKSFKSQEWDVIDKKAKAQENSDSYARDLQVAREKYLKKQPPIAVSELKAEMEAQEKLEEQKARLPKRTRTPKRATKKSVE